MKDEKPAITPPDVKFSLKDDEKKLHIPLSTDVKLPTTKDDNEYDNSVNIDSRTRMNINAEMEEEIPPSSEEVPEKTYFPPEARAHRSGVSPRMASNDTSPALEEPDQRPLIKVKVEPKHIFVKLEPVKNEDKVKLDAFANVSSSLYLLVTDRQNFEHSQT